MINEEFLSSEILNGSEEVISPTSSEIVPLDSFEETLETSEEAAETSEESTETSEEITETSSEVIYQVADLTKIENSLEVITCFIIFFAVFMLGSMVYKLVKDIF